MANDYIVRLQGQDNLSGTIRNAQRSINELGGSANRLDAIQQRFNRIEQSSAPLNKKLKDVKRAMEQLAITGDTSSELFQRMAQAAQRYQQALEQVNQATRRVDSASGQMNGRLSNLRNIANEVASRSGFGGIASSLGAIATPAGAATAAVAAVGVVMVQAGKAAAEFETHLDSLQSLTGLSDEAMQDISKGAIEMSKEFKSSASDIVDAMKLIGSQAPELLSDKDALMEVTKAANVLAEAAQIEVVDAAKGITTVMNQMGVSASEASNIINVLAASSQQGSADVAYLNTAFEKAGTAAKSAGMNYVELSAAIETVAPKFSSADVAGSQLASTLLQLSMKASNDFKPSVVGMSQALENLAAAQLSDAEIAKMVGESNVTMLKSLIEGRSTFDGYTQSLAGTNTAYEQMTINNDNFEGAVTRLKSAWDALLITLGQSGVLQGIADGVMDIMGLLNDIINVISDVISTFDLFGSDVTDNCNISKIQIQMLSDIIKGIGTVLQIVVAVAAKAFNAIKDVATNVANGIQNKWNQLKGTLTDNAFVQNIANAWTTIYNKAVEIIGKVKKLWNDFLQWLGLEGKSTSVPAPMKLEQLNLLLQLLQSYLLTLILLLALLQLEEVEEVEEEVLPTLLELLKLHQKQEVQQLQNRLTESQMMSLKTLQYLMLGQPKSMQRRQLQMNRLNSSKSETDYLQKRKKSLSKLSRKQRKVLQPMCRNKYQRNRLLLKWKQQALMNGKPYLRRQLI